MSAAGDEVLCLHKNRLLHAIVQGLYEKNEESQ